MAGAANRLQMVRYQVAFLETLLGGYRCPCAWFDPFTFSGSHQPEAQLPAPTGRVNATSPPMTVMSGVIFQMSSAGMVM